MSARMPDPRLRAGVVAALVFVLGMVVGVAADRTLGRPAVAEAAVPPLTVQDMARALRLDPGQRTRVGAVLDSLQPEIARAAAQGPDSLQAATLRARGRIAAALPSARRDQFQQWLQARHSYMMQMMRRMGPGMMGPDGAGAGTMGPGVGSGMRPGMGSGMMGRGDMGPGMMGSGRMGGRGRARP